MNEWSPSGNYSSPGTYYQSGRSLRSHWNESEKGTKLLAVNIRTMAEGRNRNIQQHSMENISKTLPTISKVGEGNGTSDPRFKRVIPPGVQNDACVGTEAKIPKASLVSDEKEVPKSKFSVWNAPESKIKKSWVESIKNSDQSKVKPKDINEPPCEKLNAVENFTFDQSQDHLKAVDKLSFNHDIVVKSLSKESLSECTVNTGNSSFVSEEFADELSNASAARVKKVQHWIHDQVQKPEKKHSVITVIGQMQDPDNLSSAFQEIDKRRKLVKELDKYAVCKKIVESDKKEEISDIMNKINSLKNGKGVLTSDSNETLNTCSYSSSKVCKNKSEKHSDILNKGKHYLNTDQLQDHAKDQVQNNFKKNLVAPNDVSADSAVPVSEQSENISMKKKIMKCQTNISCPIRGMFFSSGAYQRMFCFMIITTGILCWFALFSIQNGTFVPFDLFNSKPKPITWYEKICHWLWELFRPSGNYRRSKAWRSF